jgi:predicted DNA-binding ribbon-helix-helix protein
LLGGHKTSVILEDAFWRGIKQISGERGNSMSEMTSGIDHDRQQGNPSWAIRLFVLDHFGSRCRTDAAVE